MTEDKNEFIATVAASAAVAARLEERERIARWFRKHGREQTARQIEAGEHLN